jgi:hypothetical protein
MKLFSDNCFTRIKILRLIAVFIFQSCATHHEQFGKKQEYCRTKGIDSSKISHTFYLIGDAGNANEEKAQQTISLLEDRLKQIITQHFISW